MAAACDDLQPVGKPAGRPAMTRQPCAAQILRMRISKFLSENPVLLSISETSKAYVRMNCVSKHNLSWGQSFYNSVATLA